MQQSPNKPTNTPDCPFLALKNDPKTSLAYASTANHCFRCQAPAIPLLEHQSKYCLSTRHHECSVFQQPETMPFPPSLRQPVKNLPRQGNSWLAIWLLLSFLIVAVVLWQGSRLLTNKQALALQSAEATITAQKPEPSATLPTITAVPALLPASATSTPTATATPLQKHALETPITVDGKTYIIHMVVAGEQMVLLARDYKTSIEAIQTTNYALPQTIWTGSAVVLTPGVLSPDTTVPPFSTYKVIDFEIKIDALAEKLGVDAALLKHYNRCEDNCVLQSGDWVLVPIKK